MHSIKKKKKKMVNKKITHAIFRISMSLIAIAAVCIIQLRKHCRHHCEFHEKYGTYCQYVKQSTCEAMKCNPIGGQHQLMEVNGANHRTEHETYTKTFYDAMKKEVGESVVDHPHNMLVIEPWDPEMPMESTLQKHFSSTMEILHLNRSEPLDAHLNSLSKKEYDTILCVHCFHFLSPENYVVNGLPSLLSKLSQTLRSKTGKMIIIASQKDSDLLRLQSLFIQKYKPVDASGNPLFPQVTLEDIQAMLPDSVNVNFQAFKGLLKVSDIVERKDAGIQLLSHVLGCQVKGHRLSELEKVIEQIKVDQDFEWWINDRVGMLSFKDEF